MWIERASKQENKFVKFQGHSFGSDPKVCAQIWEDLQMTEVTHAQKVPSDLQKIKHFLMAKELYELRQESYENDSLDIFRDKITKEVPTAKHFHTLRVKRKSHDASYT
jgi:hypothetical protein